MLHLPSPLIISRVEKTAVNSGLTEELEISGSVFGLEIAVVTPYMMQLKPLDIVANVGDGEYIFESVCNCIRLVIF